MCGPQSFHCSRRNFPLSLTFPLPALGRLHTPQALFCSTPTTKYGTTPSRWAPRRICPLLRRATVAPRGAGHAATRYRLCVPSRALFPSLSSSLLAPGWGVQRLGECIWCAPVLSDIGGQARDVDRVAPLLHLVAWLPLQERSSTSRNTPRVPLAGSTPVSDCPHHWTAPKSEEEGGPDC